MFVTARNCLRGVRNITNEEYRRSFNLFGVQFALQDIDRISADYLNFIRPDLKGYILVKFFQGENVSDENMERVSFVF